MTCTTSLAGHHNPAPDSTGVTLYEHWEQDGKVMSLLWVSSSPVGMKLKAGDIILCRSWAPSGEPTIYNHARREEGTP